MEGLGIAIVLRTAISPDLFSFIRKQIKNPSCEGLGEKLFLLHLGLQELHDIQIAIGGGIAKRPVVVCLDIGSVGDKELHDIQMAIGGGIAKRLVVVCMDIDSVGKQCLE